MSYDDGAAERHPQTLRRRLRSGEESAFAELYAEHVQAVFALAQRLTGSWSSAEDVVSETFLVAWRSRAELTVEEDRPLRPWLLGIAAHQSLNVRRGLRRRLAHLARRPDPGLVADFADEVSGRLDDAERLRRTSAALARLSRVETEVIALCVWSGLSYGEAADALGVPVGTVRSRLSRARARLRELVDADPGSGPRSPVAVRTPVSRGSR